MKDDQRVALTKRLLQEGLLRLLKKEDINRISVTELCAESGINRATFYRHYTQPRDIIYDIRYDLFNKTKICVKAGESNKNPQKWVEDMCQYFYDHADILKILFRTRTDDEFVTFINELYRANFNEIRNTKPAQKFDADELKLITYCVAGGIYYILRQWIVEPIDKTPQEIAKIIYRFIES